MGRSVLSPTRLSVETMSPILFIVILLVIGSVNADVENGEDATTLTGSTSNLPDTGVTGGNDYDNYNNYEESPHGRDKRAPRRTRQSCCQFRVGALNAITVNVKGSSELRI